MLAPEKPGLAPERPRLAPERPELACERHEMAPKMPGLASERLGLASVWPKLAPGGLGWLPGKAIRILGLIARLGERTSRLLCPKIILISLVYHQLLAYAEIQHEKMRATGVPMITMPNSLFFSQ